MRAWDFHFGTRVRCGRGEAARCGKLVSALGARPLLVTYADCPALGDAVATVAQSLAAAGLDVAASARVQPEPDEGVIRRVAEDAQRHAADVIVALGGGSVIDAAKLAALLCAGAETVLGCVDTNPQRRAPQAALPIAAIPTTAGTGAESTDIAVLSGASADWPEGTAKLSVTSPHLRPRLAVLDADLLLTLDRQATLLGAIDALAHGIEACMSRAATPWATLLATHAVRLVVQGLPAALATLDDAALREPLAQAACLAGVAISHAGVTAAHGLAHGLGPVLGLSHAEAVALAMPLGLRLNAAAATGIYAELARACGLAGQDEADLAEAFVLAVERLVAEAGVRDALARPLDEQSIAQAVRLAAETTPTPIRLNPRRVSEQELRTALKSLFARA